MKQSYELDAVCIRKILKHIKAINSAYTTFKIGNSENLEHNDICQLAITQALTNIHQLRQKIQDETLAKVPLFAKLRLGLKAARNIASHDYDSLDFGIIYKITNRLLDQALIDELEAAKNVIEQSDQSD